MKYPDDFINKIICGDCLEVMKEMPDKCVDLIISDPPYEIGKAEWDIEPIGWISEAYRLLKEGGAFYCFYSCLKLPSIQPRIEKLFVLKNVCAWWSPNFPGFLKARDRYCFTWQPCIYSTKGKKANYNVYDFSRYGANNSNDVWKYPCPQSNFNLDKKQHPTQKPFKLIEQIVLASSSEKDVVFDPFLGSGTTAEACKRTKRNFIGVEINPNYCKIAEERLAQGIL